jgi:hypothetical protein
MQTFFQIAAASAGLGCLIWSVISYFRITGFLRQCTETSGEVIRLERTKSDGQFASYDYAPVFQFQTASGKTMTVTSDVGSSPPGFSEGQSVLVRYDPTNPSDARIHTFLQTWGNCVIPGGVGVFFLGIVVAQLR